MALTTIQQLDEWMTANCYNDSYGIGNRHIHEGYGLATSGDTYVWYYTERGKRETLKRFQIEQEAVEFAWKTIAADKTANRHMVGFIKGKELEAELLDELKNRNIVYWKDEIPYGGPNDKRIRVFVFGCDIHKVADLKDKYGVL
jgi:hypothetical protein